MLLHAPQDDDSGKKGGKKGGYGDDDDDDDDCGPKPTPHPTAHPTHGPTPEPTFAPLNRCQMHPEDRPCLEGCGHGMILNPWRDPFEAKEANDYRPAPCLEYDCICADSGCQKSWGPGCMAVSTQHTYHGVRSGDLFHDAID